MIKGYDQNHTRWNMQNCDHPLDILTSCPEVNRANSFHRETCLLLPIGTTNIAPVPVSYRRQKLPALSETSYVPMYLQK